MPFISSFSRFARTATALFKPAFTSISRTHNRAFLQQQVAKMSFSAMTQRLTGKTILITGASSGIGRATAIEFARTAPSDLKLILTARRLETLEEVAAEIKKEVGEGVKVLPVKLDVSKPDEVRGLLDKLPEGWKEVDVLVNNACVPIPPLPISPAHCS